MPHFCDKSKFIFTLFACSVETGEKFRGLLHHNKIFDTDIEKSNYDIKSLIVMLQECFYFGAFISNM